MNTRWTDPNPPRPFHPIAFGAAILVIIGIALIAFAPFAGANNPPAPTPNDVSYWCATGIKIENPATPFVVPAPPEGQTWVLLVLKAGDENSTPLVNETFANPVVGQGYVRTDGKSVSHAILCSVITTTTTATTVGDDPPTTTSTSTTIATTTTAPTTTVCVDCVPGQQTVPTTVGTTTTQTPCLNCRAVDTVPPTPTTVTATVATVASTVSPAAAPPLATTVALPAASTSASTPTDELPVTGGSPWWLALFGVCLIALGGLAWAWTWKP